jgi:hypothetical protein
MFFHKTQLITKFNLGLYDLYTFRLSRSSYRLSKIVLNARFMCERISSTLFWYLRLFFLSASLADWASRRNAAFSAVIDFFYDSYSA